MQTEEYASHRRQQSEIEIVILIILEVQTAQMHMITRKSLLEVAPTTLPQRTRILGRKKRQFFPLLIVNFDK